MRTVHPLHLLAAAALASLMACGHDGNERARAAGSGPTYAPDGALLGGPPPARAGRPNVLMLVIDTLRADVVDPIEPARAAMPFLSGLAQQGVCFTQASAPAPWTLPSMASLLTSRLPHEHGITSEVIESSAVERLPTLPEVLQRSHGYHTAALTGGLGPQVARALGQGFDEASDHFALRAGSQVLTDWAARRDRERPFFLLLHSFEAHDAYGQPNHPHPRAQPTAPELDAAAASLRALGTSPDAAELAFLSLTSAAHANLLQRSGDFRPLRATLNRYLWDGLVRKPDPGLCTRLSDAYRDGAAWVDAELRRTHDFLREQGLLENTLLVIVGDHGEAFGEHGALRHGNVLYDEVLRVPLIVSGPAPFDRPALIEGSVGLTDVPATVLDMLGAPPLDDADGRSLLPLVRAGGGAGRAVEAQEVRTPMHTAGASWARVASLRSASWKYICTHDLTAGTLLEEVYDLRSDPGERLNRAGPDGLVGALPFDEDFCRGVERIRARLWGQAAQVDHQIAQGYGAGLQLTSTPRPQRACEAGDSP